MPFGQKGQPLRGLVQHRGRRLFLHPLHIAAAHVHNRRPRPRSRFFGQPCGFPGTGVGQEVEIGGQHRAYLIKRRSRYLVRCVQGTVVVSVRNAYDRHRWHANRRVGDKAIADAVGRLSPTEENVIPAQVLQQADRQGVHTRRCRSRRQMKGERRAAQFLIFTHHIRIDRRHGSLHSLFIIHHIAHEPAALEPQEDTHTPAGTWEIPPVDQELQRPKDLQAYAGARGVVVCSLLVDVRQHQHFLVRLAPRNVPRHVLHDPVVQHSIHPGIYLHRAFAAESPKLIGLPEREGKPKHALLIPWGQHIVVPSPEVGKVDRPAVKDDAHDPALAQCLPI